MPGEQLMTTINRAILLRLPDSVIDRLDFAVSELRFRSRAALLRRFVQRQLEFTEAHELPLLRKRAVRKALEPSREDHKMSDKTISATRETLICDIEQQICNDVEETLLQHAPDEWPDEQLDEIKDQVLQDSRLVLTALSTNELESSGALRAHIAAALAQTRQLLHEGRGVAK
jgi:Arc/MetJ-type ribon-helix-helix transcriptional regulator